MRAKLFDKIRIEHILGPIDEVQGYTAGLSFDDFMFNSMLRFASVKQLEIVGEAASAVTVTTRAKFTNVPWKKNDWIEK